MCVCVSSFQCFYRVSPENWLEIRIMFAIDRFCDGGGNSGGGSIDGVNDAAASSYPTRCDTDIYMAQNCIELNKKTTQENTHQPKSSQTDERTHSYCLRSNEWMAPLIRARQENLAQKNVHQYSCTHRHTHMPACFYAFIIWNKNTRLHPHRWAIKNCIVIRCDEMLWIWVFLRNVYY